LVTILKFKNEPPDIYSAAGLSRETRSETSTSFDASLGKQYQPGEQTVYARRLRHEDLQVTSRILFSSGTGSMIILCPAWRRKFGARVTTAQAIGP
jgi:hypothetical protein